MPVPSPEAGDLIHQVYIENVTAMTKTAMQTNVATVQTVATRRAKIVATKGEGLSVGPVNTRTNLGHYQISFRYCPLLTINSRIRWGELNYSTLRSDELRGLTSEELSALPGSGPAPSYYRITGINDLDSQHVWQICDVVKVDV